ncbi:MAG: tetratricopeptide repeat protein, partial [Planctomycetales bacterium]
MHHSRPHAKATRKTMLRGFRWTAWVFLLGLPLTIARGGIGPENVVVVVNSDSWSSRAVANEYVRLRGIPDNNVVYLEDVPNPLRVDVEIFRKRVLVPMFKAMESRGISGQIDCVAYSSDLPYSVDLGLDFLGRKPSRVITPVGSINGLTYLYPLVLAKRPEYAGLAVNRYCRRPLPLVSVNLKLDQKSNLEIAARFIREKKWSLAAGLLRKLIEQEPQVAPWRFDLARCMAHQGELDKALDALEQAIEFGWSDAARTINAPGFAAVRNSPRFQGLLEQMKRRKFTMQPTLGFRAARQWSASGEIVPTGGSRYLLSTMLGMTSGRGNSLDEVLDCLRSAAAADGTRPRGTVYFVSNSDVRSVTRHGKYEIASRRLRQLGVQAQVIQGGVPISKPDVQGAMMGLRSFNWKDSKSIIRPGAICDHLTSFGGVLQERASQTPLTELIRHGAAGASGTVTEPYAIQAKFPLPSLHVHYAQGCSLAEAFYQSVEAPYQLLIVGDPLCRPWAKIPQVLVSGVPANGAVSGRLTLRPSEKSDGAARFELFLDGMRRAVCKPGETFDLNTESWDDGSHLLSVVAVAKGPIGAQARRRIPVTVNNHGVRLAMTATPPTRVAWDQPLRLAAKTPGAARIAFYHNRRSVGLIRGESGQVEIDPRTLGMGTVVLQPIALLKENFRRVRGQPIVVEVVPPSPRKALASPAFASLSPGLRLKTGASGVAVEDV